MVEVTPRTAQTVLDEFRWRGFIHRTDDGQELYTPGLDELLAREKVTAYIGFDPTSDSLTHGNLVGIMALVHLQRHGHRPIAIAGGGTGMIGDPSGRSSERPLLSREQIEHNVQSIRVQLNRYLEFIGEGNAALVVNNADWLAPLNMLDFLRDVGKHFTINNMLAKESVQSRLAQGISFTEFSYMLLQAYDYLTLYDRYGCKLQMGGSDQWGNITAGVELIRRVRGGQAHGLVTLLVTSSTGRKYSKSEGTAIWLDPRRTSPFKYYQFWFNTVDADVVRFLKIYTLLSQEEIAALEEAVASRPERREAQRRLAEEATLMNHGESGLQAARRASEVLFGGDMSGLSAEQLLEVFEDVPSISLPKHRLEGEGVPLIELLEQTGLAPSRSEARRLVQGGGVVLSGQRVSDARYSVTLENSVDGRVIVLRRGAREYRLVKLEG
ncbi:MAG: tyrosine--tRNA ligase [Chloroflexi bacterium]|nr:tyrosine--tRNA ligase [Chloroflexota bacterium]